MKRSYVIGGIVAAAVLAGGGAATGVALVSGGDPAGSAYGAPAAPASGAAALGTAALPPGSALVDGAGRALYLFEADKGTTSACSGPCTQVWPPVLDTGATPAVSGGVQAALVGTTTRDDGTRQVTYNGHPLYLFAGDKTPGEAHGQGLNQFGGGWYVVSAGGDKIDDSAVPAPAGGGYGY
jgi:predicted lipoprotein with Yx(FWY)xxD motif